MLPTAKKGRCSVSVIDDVASVIGAAEISILGGEHAVHDGGEKKSPVEFPAIASHLNDCLPPMAISQSLSLSFNSDMQQI
jgi:hypothetical protein